MACLRLVTLPPLPPLPLLSVPSFLSCIARFTFSDADLEYFLAICLTFPKLLLELKLLCLLRFPKDAAASNLVL
jgi:hypothetical protein